MSMKTVKCHPKFSELDKLQQKRERAQENICKMNEQTYSGNFMAYLKNGLVHSIDLSDYGSLIISLIPAYMIAKTLGNLMYAPLGVLICMIALISGHICSLYLNFRYDLKRLCELTEEYLMYDEQCKTLEQELYNIPCLSQAEKGEQNHGYTGIQCANHS